MLSGLFRILILTLIIYIVYIAVKAWQAVSGGRAPRRRPAAGGAMVKDKVCDTYVPEDEALRLVRDGREHFFCCEDCRRKFLESGEPPARQ